MFLLFVGSMIILLFALTAQNRAACELLTHQRRLLAQQQATHSVVAVVQPLAPSVATGGASVAPTPIEPPRETPPAPARRRDPPAVFPSGPGELPPELQGIDDRRDHSEFEE